MAVTCSFKTRYGTIVTSDGYKCGIYAGGNCWMVVTYKQGKTHHLQTFVSELKHLKNLSRGDFWTKYFRKATIYTTLPHWRIIVQEWASSGLEVTIKTPRK